MRRALLLLDIPELPELAFREGAGGSRPATLEGGGGGSSSSSTSTTSIDKRQVVESGIGISSDAPTNLELHTSDYGAIASAVNLAQKTTEEVTKQLNATIDLAKTSSAGTGKTFEQTIGFAEKVLGLTKENINLALKNVDQINSAYTTVGDLSTGNRTIAQTGLVVAGLVAAAIAVPMLLKGKS